MHRKVTRKTVMSWAVSKDMLPTLCRLDEIETIDPFVKTLKFQPVRGVRGLSGTPSMLPLHLAVVLGHVDIVIYLLEEKTANVNAISGIPGTPRRAKHFARTSQSSTSSYPTVMSVMSSRAHRFWARLCST